MRVMRALARYVCDGQVDAYLPPHVNEGTALWQVKHDNGDRYVQLLETPTPIIIRFMCVCIVTDVRDINRSIVTLAAVRQFQHFLQIDATLSDIKSSDRY